MTIIKWDTLLLFVYYALSLFFTKKRKKSKINILNRCGHNNPNKHYVSFYLNYCIILTGKMFMIYSSMKLSDRSI